jgi:hypothetical protein
MYNFFDLMAARFKDLPPGELENYPPEIYL